MDCCILCMQMDRFIPTRSALDFDLANLHLTKENGSSTEAGSGLPNSSPSKDEYQKMLADSLGVDSSGRILAFKQKVQQISLALIYVPLLISE